MFGHRAVYDACVAGPASSAAAREIRCPRCGYDQRGAISTWSNSCPLEGVCTECGLKFPWCEILKPEKFEPRWCVEYAPRLHEVPWAAGKTFVRSFWPWGFWSRLQMSHRVRWLRLATYAGLLPVLLLLPTYVIAQTALSLQVRAAVERNLASWAQTNPGVIQARKAQMAQALQRQKQSVLANADGRLSDGEIGELVEQIDAAVADLPVSAAPHIDASALRTTLEAVFSPLAATSSASIVLAAGTTQPYVAPCKLIAWSPSQSNASTGELPKDAAMLVAWLAWGVGMSVLLPLALALMPASLHKAKVRRFHIVRVTVYGLFIPVLLLLVLGLRLGLAAVQGAPILTATSPVIRVVPWLAIALWWHAATRRYLKIPHAWLTIGLLTLLCLLGLLGITAAISQPLAWEMLDLFDLLIR